MTDRAKRITELTTISTANTADFLAVVANTSGTAVTRKITVNNFINTVVLPTANTSKIGGVKVGTGLTVNASGFLSLSVPLYNMVKTNKDAFDVYTTTTYTRLDSTVYKTIVLSGGTPPYYTTRTETYYANDGITSVTTVVYTLTYDGNQIITETINV